MFKGKLKAVTLSYDDGREQDARLVELFNRYGLKATFNLNTELAGMENRIPVSDFSEIYFGHEVAVHTLTHPRLDDLDSDEEITRQIEEDRKNLEKIVGYPVCGMAYPYGEPTDGGRVLKLVRESTKIKYSRGTTPTYNFELQDDLLDFRPTIHHGEFDKLMHLAYEFIEMKPDTPKLFYVWGHSYEFDYENGNCWSKMEEFCKLISGRDDIFYGTNREVFGF